MDKNFYRDLTFFFAIALFNLLNVIYRTFNPTTDTTGGLVIVFSVFGFLIFTYLIGYTLDKNINPANKK